MVHAVPVTSSTVVVAVDVGKSCVALSVTDAARHRLLGPVEFAMTAPALSAVVERIVKVLPDTGALVKIGVEAAGHYHRPMLSAPWPPGWEVLELNPAHVAEQRRIQGRRRLKTDAIDLDAITELVLSGRGIPLTAAQDEVIGCLQAWSAHRTRRVLTRTATKNQLLGQPDRSFPGLTLALPDVLRTKVGRLVAAHFADPKRLAALGSVRFVRFAAAAGFRSATGWPNDWSPPPETHYLRARPRSPARCWPLTWPC